MKVGDGLTTFALWVQIYGPSAWVVDYALHHQSKDYVTVIDGLYAVITHDGP